MLKGLKKHKGTLLIIVLMVLVYEITTDIFNILDPLLFPGLKIIISTLIASLPELFKGLLSSLNLLIPSFTLSLVLGVSLGLVVGWYKPIRTNVTPIIYGLSPIPPTLYIPYAIMLLPTFWHSSAFIIFIGSFWPIINGTIHGVSIIEQKYIDNARTLEIRGVKLLFKIILPAALLTILGGIGTGLNFSFILLTIAEMFAARSGLGYFIQYYADFSEYNKVLAGLLFMSFFIIIVMTIFSKIQKRMLHWRTNK
ncbi:MAG: ABC transporter permease subunit [Clostridium botulinum]|uniref:ABC transporter permease n=1 Tax=uncultured Clostridium sp. TaxID=59620 RepID=UPI00280A9E5E|nr:ABC transporter permease subunit [uncultured Clostridium sp.]MDU6877434.1 ABC transporter permease subunit [Clostridium botulinum]